MFYRSGGCYNFVMIACFEAIVLSPDFDRIAKDIDVKNLQTGFGKPVLILHGDKDELVPLYLCGCNCRLTNFQAHFIECNHCFLYSEFNENNKQIFGGKNDISRQNY